MRRWIFFLAMLLGGFRLPAAETPPNIVLILIDDLGWSDLSVSGSSFYRTPNIDRLAASGVRFLQAYSACTVCSPSRAAILTGRYPAALHVTDWIPGHARPKAALQVPDWTMHLEPREITLAELLRKRGYVCASIGKWHLGEKEFGPETQGFRLNKAGTNRGQPVSYFSPYKNPALSDGPAGEYLTDRESAEAVSFIEKNAGHPFFLYLAHHAVHTPIQAKPEIRKKYEAAAGTSAQTNAAYAAMIESMDASVGRVCDTLQKLQLAEKTVVVFTSDNGGLLPITSNRPLRAGKGSAYEGGVRVPMILRFPGGPSGKTVSEPVMGIDLFTTLAMFAQIHPGELPAGTHGVSLLPVMTGGTLADRKLFWHYPHYHPGGATPYGAVRDGDWKLIEFYEDGFLELYNLRQDPSEQNNVANQDPARREAMHRTLIEWRKSMNAQMPSPNPAFDPAAEPPPAHVIRPQSNGTVLLHARDVRIHGDTVRYEPQPHKNTVGYWTHREDWVSWDFVTTRGGRFAVDILQGCGPGSGGSQVKLQIDDGTPISFTVQETKGFQDFLERRLGELELAPGRHQLKIIPQTKPGLAVMDVREVRIVPL